MNLAHWLERSAAIHGTRPALALGNAVVCDYRQFASRAARGAGWLLAQGLVPGDRVGLFRGNDADYLMWLWSTWWAGLVAVPINAKLHGLEAAYILGHSGARLCLVDSERAAVLGGYLPDGCAMAVSAIVGATGATAAPAVNQVGARTGGGTSADPRESGAVAAAESTAAPLALPAARQLDALDPAPIADRSEDDDVWLFYTSGTTGRPKGVQLSARNLRWATMGYLAEVQPIGPGHTMLHPAPLSHGAGIYHLPYVLKGALNVVPASGGFDSAEIAALASHWGKASLFAAPTMVHRLVEWAATRLRNNGSPPCKTHAPS